MRRLLATILSVEILLGLATPRRAFAEETSRPAAPASIVLQKSPIALDLPARSSLEDVAADGIRSPLRPFAPARPRPVLSEDGWLVVGAAAIVGVLLLVVVVGGLAD